jgi:hypothetical protein
MEQVDSGTLAPKAAAALARLEPEQQRQVAEQAVATGSTAEEVRRAVRQKQGKAAPPKKQRDLVFRIRVGLRVLVSSRQPIAGPEVVAALEVALEQARALLDPN